MFYTHDIHRRVVRIFKTTPQRCFYNDINVIAFKCRDHIDLHITLASADKVSRIDFLWYTNILYDLLRDFLAVFRLVFRPVFLTAFLPVFFAGTFPPLFRASESPIAIACFRLVTFLPLRPLFNVPFLRSCIAFFTLRCAVFPYFAIGSPFLNYCYELKNDANAASRRHRCQPSLIRRENARRGS